VTYKNKRNWPELGKPGMGDSKDRHAGWTETMTQGQIHTRNTWTIQVCYSFSRRTLRHNTHTQYNNYQYIRIIISNVILLSYHYMHVLEKIIIVTIHIIILGIRTLTTPRTGMYWVFIY